MQFFFKKISLRRSKVRKNINVEQRLPIGFLTDADSLISILLVLVFVTFCTAILSFNIIGKTTYLNLFSTVMILLLVSIGAAFYIYHYQKRIIKNHARAVAIAGLFILLLAATRIGVLSFRSNYLATGTAVTAAIILTIAYDQRFAIGMSIFYCLLACYAARPMADIDLLFTMMAGIFTCVFSLREIRTRMKLIEVSALVSAIVFITSCALQFLQPDTLFTDVLINAAYHAGTTFLVGLFIQSFLPIIEKAFRIATSMTLLDYSDANQPLLKKLALEAPGTFSHSLLVGSIAEAAAEAIGRNGLLCRVGAYYHDIGKINKPGYFVENEIGSSSRHKELAPTMSQLIIVGHVKDGIELAKEYGLPAVLRQFIETHHGTTLVEYFYNEAKKKKDSSGPAGSSGKKQNQPEPSETEFRYQGPKPRIKEAAIVMLSDTIEGAVRSLSEITPTRIAAVVHNMAMKKLQDGQFDECDMSLRELSKIEASITKTLAAHYHGRIAYPKPPDVMEDIQPKTSRTKQKK